MADTEPLAVLADVVRTLDELGIAYAVGGSYASSLYGELRLTRDADLIVSLSSDLVEPLASRLERAFYLSRDAMHEAVRDVRSFNAVHLKTGFKVDFFVVGTDEFDRSELQRRVLRNIEAGSGFRLWFKSPEDTLLRKLLWYRQGGEVSERQWRDVVGILVRMKDALDREYLNEWAIRIGVRDLLDQAQRDSGLR